MNEQQARKIASLGFLICGALAGLMMMEFGETVWALARLPVPQGWVMAPSDMIAIGAGFLTYGLLHRNQRAMRFTIETIGELAKVTWPPRKETVLSTGVVSVLVGICAMILFGFDALWGTMVNIFYR